MELKMYNEAVYDCEKAYKMEKNQGNIESSAVLFNRGSAKHLMGFCEF